MQPRRLCHPCCPGRRGPALALAVVVSVGLLVPWAAIRSAHYKLERISLQAEQGLGGFLAAAQEEVGAVGDEAGELLGFDFGL